MGIILFSAKHEQLPLSMFLTQSYLQIFHTYAALTASPLVYMNNHNLIISKLCLTGSNKWSGMPWLFSLQGPIFRVLKKITSASQKSKQNFRKQHGDKNESAIGNMLPMGQMCFVFVPLSNGCSILFSFCIIQKCSINKINSFFTGFFSTVKTFIPLKLFSDSFQLPFQFNYKTLEFTTLVI